MKHFCAWSGRETALEHPGPRHFGSRQAALEGQEAQATGALADYMRSMSSKEQAALDEAAGMARTRSERRYGVGQGSALGLEIDVSVKTKSNDF